MDFRLSDEQRLMIDAARKATGRPIEVVEGPRRPGDPPALIAAADSARNSILSPARMFFS